MSLDQQTLAQLAQVSATLNLILESAKTNDELPAMNPVAGDAKLRAFINGASRTLTIQQIISAAVAAAAPYNDKILNAAGFELDGNDLTMDAGWEWVINTNQYSNPDAQVLNIPFAASGKSRIDIILATTSHNFMRLPGTESTGTPVAPATPLNSVLATFVTVTDGTISQPSNPSFGQYKGLFETIEEFEVYTNSNSVGRPSNGDFALIFDGTDLTFAILRAGSWQYKLIGSGGSSVEWHEQYLNFDGDPIEIPAGFTGSIINMDAPQNRVEFTISGTDLTITDGATSGDYLRIIGIKPS